MSFPETNEFSAEKQALADQALIEAAARGDALEAARLIGRENANPAAKDREGLDALARALDSREFRCVCLLIDALRPISGQDFADRHGNGHLAIAAGGPRERNRESASFHEERPRVAIENTRAILALRGDAEARRLNNDGQTPLMAAVAARLHGVVDLLAPLSDMSAVDRLGMDVVDMALSRNGGLLAARLAKHPNATPEQRARVLEWIKRPDGSFFPQSARATVIAQLEQLTLKDAVSSVGADSTEKPLPRRGPRAL